MQEDLSMRRLLIISDTAVYKKGNETFAYEPVVREIQSYAHIFDQIVWLGSKVDTLQGSMCDIILPNLKIVSMPNVRSKYLNAINVVLAYPAFLYYILKYFFSSTHIHTRGPSHPALLGILFSKLDMTKMYWHKFAGNWNGKLPITYAVQRSLLKKLRASNIHTTVNGSWNDSNPQILSFENPCLSDEELICAWQFAEKKDFSGDLHLLYVGELSEAKGIRNLIDALKDGNISTRINKVTIVGEGPLFNEVQKITTGIDSFQIELTGSLNRAELNSYYTKAHILILPSIAEGFPKVVAEAAAYGCIPIVTNISSMSQYVLHSQNGILMPDNSPSSITNCINELVWLPMKNMSLQVMNMSDRFTYSSFLKRLQKEIFTA
jgi:glycosyltransferase involved in cell wall biosynthesis